MSGDSTPGKASRWQPEQNDIFNNLLRDCGSAEYSGDMIGWQRRFPSSRAFGVFAIGALFAFGVAKAGTAAAQAEPPKNQASIAAGAGITVDERGQAAVPLDGPWRFHLGDDPAWADPGLDDSHWEKLSADRPWGEQGHASYAGFAWYRAIIDFSSTASSVSGSGEAGSGQSVPIALLVPHVESAYEVYWNGVLIGSDGKLPPNPVYYLRAAPPKIFRFNAGEHGVLAFRVWKAPLLSDDTGRHGGFENAPMAGSERAIATRRGLMDYGWLRSQQFFFGVNLIYGLVALLSLLTWLQDRKQWPALWMFGFAVAPLIFMLFYGVRIPWPSPVANALWQPVTSIRDICLWLLLLWLLQLREDRRLVRFVWVCAWVSISAEILDSAPYFLAWVPGWLIPMQIEDATMVAIWIPTGIVPLVLVGAAVLSRKRLDSTRWTAAILAFANSMLELVRTLAPQGSRFTHWTLADKIERPLFTLGGNAVFAPTLGGALLLIATGYAVYRSSSENRRKQNALEQEFESARELQRVLIPETLPTVPGYLLTSGYLPAQQVGGDFFQIIPLDKTGPLEGNRLGSTLVVVGDVSGKGLKAAMAVSFIVGAVRALANILPGPGQLLSELNQRLISRLQGGFATCIILLLHEDGKCVIASAGHPAPFLNDADLSLQGAFPLGLFPDVVYDETTIHLKPGDRCTLYTDGLLEARSADGELYGFDRLLALLSTRPNAAQAVDAAVEFGQDDDITVVTLTRTS